MVEHAAVNRRVVGSSPTSGAISKQAPLQGHHKFLGFSAFPAHSAHVWFVSLLLN